MLALTLALLLAHVDCRADARAEVVQGTTSARSDALELHVGGLLVREGEPGLAFALVRLGKGSRRPAYVLVLKHRLGGGGKSDFDSSATAEDEKGEARQAITVAGRAIRLEYKVVADPKTGKAASETLTLGGKVADLERGRLFLVDLSGATPTWEQRKVDLPAGDDAATGKKAAAALARKILEQARAKDERSRKFIESATGR